MSLTQGVSIDDQDIPTLPKTPPPNNYPERRAHSSSPVKNRKLILPHLYNSRSTSTIASEEEDLRSILACPNLTSAQLKRISKNPVTKKLHVAALSENSKYIIPIPFTLKLPPRLTTSTDNSSCSSLISPTKSESSFQESPPRVKQSKLVFTQKGYEKVDSSSDEEVEDFLDIQPKYVLPRTKQFNETLSIIEEVSNIGSRTNTIKREKSLPPTPTVEDIRPKVPTKKLIKKLTRKPPPMEDKILPILPGDTPHPKQIVVSQSTNKVNDSSVLKIDKRSFSDESLVSSISELSSVGDFINQARILAKSPPITVKYVPITNNVTRVPINSQLNSTKVSPDSVNTNAAKKPSLKHEPQSNQLKSKPQQSKQVQHTPNHEMKQDHPKSKQLVIPQLQVNSKPPMEHLTLPKPQFTRRNISESSTSSNDSLDSTQTWDSIQESIDISLSRPTPPKKPYRKSFPLLDHAKQKPRRLSDSSWVDITEEEEEEEEIEPLRIHKKDSDASSKETTPDEQFQRNYQFPNSLQNITNNKELKRKVSSTSSHKSRHSFYSNGQIEIPNLDDLNVMDEYSSKSSYTGTTFSDTKTQTTVSDVDENFLGVPSKQALNHLQNQFNKLGDDSDSEVFSMGKLYAAPELSKTLPDLQPTSQNKSPIRHARHRSMFNIDFNPSDVNPVMEVNHVRAQSMNTAKDAIGELMDIKVASPPEKVNYAVDFKESDTVTEDNFPMTKLPDLRKSKSEKKSKKKDSDTESVVIDLTEDEYDLCLINRKDSILSYKSVTEKLNGKEVEVVLVDEVEEIPKEEDKELSDEYDDTEDELSSIYSKYRQNWMFRSNTTTSTSSYVSAVDSLSQIKQARKVEIKSVNTSSGRIIRELNLKRSNGSINSSSSYKSNRIQPPIKAQSQRKSMPLIESNYFDYKTTDSYDFNTFMKQRIESSTLPK